MEDGVLNRQPVEDTAQSALTCLRCGAEFDFGDEDGFARHFDEKHGEGASDEG